MGHAKGPTTRTSRTARLDKAALSSRPTKSSQGQHWAHSSAADKAWTSPGQAGKEKLVVRPQLSWLKLITHFFLKLLEEQEDTGFASRRTPRGQEEDTAFTSMAKGQKETKRRTQSTQAWLEDSRRTPAGQEKSTGFASRRNHRCGGRPHRGWWWRHSYPFAAA